jgi:hypothetical protein
MKVPRTSPTSLPQFAGTVSFERTEQSSHYGSAAVKGRTAAPPASGSPRTPGTAGAGGDPRLGVRLPDPEVSVSGYGVEPRPDGKDDQRSGDHRQEERSIGCRVIGPPYAAKGELQRPALAPHSPQNFCPLGFSCWHRGQGMRSVSRFLANCRPGSSVTAPGRRRSSAPQPPPWRVRQSRPYREPGSDASRRLPLPVGPVADPVAFHLGDIATGTAARRAGGSPGVTETLLESPVL